MKCEYCGFELADNAKFCPDCGQKVIKKTGFNLGEKNVIAGDVYGSKEDIHISGNATFIKKDDDTSKISPCAICGRHILLLSGFTCRKCGKFVCAECYNRKHKVCSDCAEGLEASESKEKVLMKNIESFIKTQVSNFDSPEDFSESAKTFLKEQLSSAFTTLKDKSRYSLDMVFVENESEPSVFFASHPVTQKEFADVMGYNPAVFSDSESKPVESVSWYEALVFCNRLSLRDKLKPCYLIGGTSDTEKWISDTGEIPEDENEAWEKVQLDRNANGYRLPSLKEWEYAARSGKKHENFEYAGTDFFDECAWCSSNSKNSTQDVCRKNPNSLGIYDLCGNVGEWCFESGDDITKTVKGGNFSEHPDGCKISSSIKEYSYEKNLAIGFRVCASDIEWDGTLELSLEPARINNASEDNGNSDDDPQDSDSTKTEQTPSPAEEKTFECIPLGKEQDFDVEVYSMENAKIVLGNIENRMILVEGGKKQLGSADDELKNPLHTVEVKSFYISQVPVTQKIFKFIMGTEKISSNQETFGDELPICCTGYVDAVAFCNTLSRLAGLEPVYTVGGKTDPCDWKGFQFPKEGIDPDFRDDFKISINKNADGYRLPFSDEFEFASRGGMKSLNFKYSGSDRLEEAAWCSENCNDVIHEVGTKKPNELGLYDMMGNVKQWLNNTVVTNTDIRESADSRAFTHAVSHIWTDDLDIESRYNYVGFRIARNSQR